MQASVLPSKRRIIPDLAHLDPVPVLHHIARPRLQLSGYILVVVEEFGAHVGAYGLGCTTLMAATASIVPLPQMRYIETLCF